jgi:beta-galactosidase
VWGSPETAVFSYDPATYDKVETLSSWGFPGVWERWNWEGQENKPVRIVVFSAAEEVELWVNGVSLGRRKAGEALSHAIPLTFVFETVYIPGTVEAVSYTDGKEISRAKLETTGKPATVRLTPETETLKADGASLCYVRAELVDENGCVVPDADCLLTAEAEGAASLQGFGSGNPITDENYTRGKFTTWQGCALAVLRAGCEAGEVCLKVAAQGLPGAEITLKVKEETEERAARSCR